MSVETKDRAESVRVDAESPTGGNGDGNGLPADYNAEGVEIYRRELSVPTAGMDQVHVIAWIGQMGRTDVDERLGRAKDESQFLFKDDTIVVGPDGTFEALAQGIAELVDRLNAPARNLRYAGAPADPMPWVTKDGAIERLVELLRNPRIRFEFVNSLAREVGDVLHNGVDEDPDSDAEGTDSRTTHTERRCEPIVTGDALQAIENARKENAKTYHGDDVFTVQLSCGGGDHFSNPLAEWRVFGKPGTAEEVAQAVSGIVGRFNALRDLSPTCDSEDWIPVGMAGMPRHGNGDKAPSDQSRAGHIARVAMLLENPRFNVWDARGIAIALTKRLQELTDEEAEVNTDGNGADVPDVSNLLDDGDRKIIKDHREACTSRIDGLDTARLCIELDGDDGKLGGDLRDIYSRTIVAPHGMIERLIFEADALAERHSVIKHAEVGTA